MPATAAATKDTKAKDKRPCPDQITRVKIFSSVPVLLWDAPTALKLFMLWLIPAVLELRQDHSCRSAWRGAKLGRKVTPSFASCLQQRKD